MVRYNNHWRLLLIIYCALGFSACNVINLESEADLPDLPYALDLQSAIDQVLIDNPVDHPLGLSAAVIVPGYEPWLDVAGYSQADVPITTDMIFDAGSIEKSFQAALIMELAAEGRLALDDPISDYLPDLPNMDESATIRQLLNHTSGIANVFEHPEFPWLGPDVDYSRNWELEEVFSNFVLPPYDSPGRVQHYSSTNYLLATKIVEVVTGSSVPSEIQQRFLEPMKLQHTFISMGEEPILGDTVAHAWMDVDSDGVLEDIYGIPRTWQASLTHPVMFANANDLARWTHSLYHEGIILNASMMEEMLTFPEEVLRDPEGGIYGLGVVDYSNILGEEAIGHLGSSLGYTAAALYLPEYEISVAWLINIGQSPHDLAARLMRETWASVMEVLEKNRNWQQ
ncbi:MAG: serine hydrolase [Anaerolineales bacterium]|nr:serine hydrolase [Anaerolineales bacterium]